MPRAPRKTTVEAPVTIPNLDVRLMEISLISDAPLICHNWSAKNKKQITDKQQQKAEEPKEARDPEQEYRDSLYPFPGGGYGFPANAFKSAAVDACSHIKGITKVEARGAFHILTDLLKLDGEPRMRTDTVRIGMGTGDIRYRAEFATWSVLIPIQYNRAVLSDAQIVQLFQVAGFSIGVGDWRPQKDGSFGRFHVSKGR
jgi:hypothetical protein